MIKLEIGVSIEGKSMMIQIDRLMREDANEMEAKIIIALEGRVEKILMDAGKNLPGGNFIVHRIGGDAE